MLVLTLGYIALIAVWMLWRGIVATPDYLLLMLAPVALLAGRLKAWFTDWVPFICLLLLWEGMRSLAYRFAATGVHWGNLRPELVVFQGRLPGVWLQEAVDAAGAAGIVDRLAAGVDLLHFPATLALALVVWLSVVYLGEHYVLDVVTGVGLASLAWGAVALASGRLAARAAALPVSDGVRAA